MIRQWKSLNYSISYVKKAIDNYLFIYFIKSYSLDNVIITISVLADAPDTRGLSHYILRYVKVVQPHLYTKGSLFIPRPRSRGGGYCHHHVWSCVCASVFRYRTIYLNPLARLLSYCIHISLRGCRCAFWGYYLWPSCWPLILRRLLTLNDWGW